MTPRLRAAAVAALVAVIIHADWHFARPAHHRLSLAWEEHWLFAAFGFALVGWLVARWWPDRRWRMAAATVAAGVLVAQGIEPVLEVLTYQGRFGFPDEPERWRAFAVCLAAGLPALAAVLWLRQSEYVKRPS